MARLTDLADACRKSGLKVVEVDGWRTRGSSNYNPSGGAIIVHHTATSSSARGNYPSLRIVRDGRAGLPGPLSQLGLGRDGTVYVIASGRANHAGPSALAAQGNTRSIGIEAEHSGRGPWPTVQYRAYVKLVAALCAHYDKPASRVFGHKESAVPRGRKVDPNFSMDRFRADVIVEMKGGTNPVVITPVKPRLTRAQCAAVLRQLSIEPVLAGKIAMSNLSKEAIDGLATANLRLPIKRANRGATLSLGDTLLPGEDLVGASGDRLAFQGDGNLVMYHGDKAVWTPGVHFSRLAFRNDGNVVGYIGSIAMWSTNTTGGRVFGVQPDGHLVLRDGNSEAIWATGKHR